eukprot:TRINITY_DN11516_c0_g1_i1.p1 TRINITY_DN11516_c0_g1~~TRINITY_DN11516_c0_g1_i1.p1  ORF type:complete len:176 (-),score=28.65 TRINITY_DN11516_c0_g1_i1:120-623(-)
MNKILSKIITLTSIFQGVLMIMGGLSDGMDPVKHASNLLPGLENILDGFYKDPETRPIIPLVYAVQSAEMLFVTFFGLLVVVLNATVPFDLRFGVYMVVAVAEFSLFYIQNHQLNLVGLGKWESDDAGMKVIQLLSSVSFSLGFFYVFASMVSTYCYLNAPAKKKLK